MGNSDWRPRYFAINENHDLYKWGFDLDENIAAVTSTTPVLSSGTSCALSIDDFERSNLMVYPNPCNNFFNIHFFDVNQIEKVEIYNEIGQLLYKQDIFQIDSNEISIDVTDYAKGIYFIKVVSNNTPTIIKVIKSNP